MAKVAILGFGTVGSGVFEIFDSKDFTKKTGEEIKVEKILDIRDFDNHPKKELFTKNFDDILKNPDISAVAETMGGLHPAYEYTKELLQAGKSVITSNKELVATYGPELMQIAKKKNVRYLFEASVGGGIPIIRPLSSCLLANDIERIAGILNGTTNFILTEMISKGRDFDTALKDAQEKGYAERNPASDVEGYDTCRKIAILSSMAWGEFVDYNDIQTEGICQITKEDVDFAKQIGASVKLIGYAQKVSGKIYAVVAPMVVSSDLLLSSVNDVFNAVMVTGDSLGDSLFYGKGAGKLATASAVCADVIDAVKNAENTIKSVKWEMTENNMLDPSKKEWRYFVRTKEDIEKVKSLFTDIKLLEEVNTEKGFVTQKMSEKEFLEKVDNLKVNYLRILEA